MEYSQKLASQRVIGMVYQGLERTREAGRMCTTTPSYKGNGPIEIVSNIRKDLATTPLGSYATTANGLVGIGQDPVYSLFIVT